MKKLRTLKFFITKRYKIKNIEVPEDIANLIDDSIDCGDYAYQSDKIEKWLKDNANLDEHQIEGTDMIFHE